MGESVAIFKLSVSELTKIVSKFKKLKIKGIDDKKGYDEVYQGLQEVKTLRVDITRYGKEKREEAIKVQKEVLRQEKELLGIIAPVESRLKEEREKIDNEKKKQERIILLPSRKALLKEIGETMEDEEILLLDEKEFSVKYMELKTAFDLRKQEEKEEKERAEAKEKDLERARQEAREIAIVEEKEKAERDKKEAIANLKREQEEKEQAEKARLESEERARQEMEKEKEVQKFLSVNNYNEETDKIEHSGSEIKLYRLVAILTKTK